MTPPARPLPSLRRALRHGRGGRCRGTARQRQDRPHAQDPATGSPARDRLALAPAAAPPPRRPAPREDPELLMDDRTIRGGV